ncbi:MAG: hypothetical protein IT405_00260 [Candidatus Yanofskybacteria bacterium]|nr:hypothetical protein [Candidatus Yanofskybacteria bacterium]
MRYTLFVLGILAVVVGGWAVGAHADESTPQEFLYAFHIRWASGVPSWAQTYELTTGAQATPTAGAWALRVLSSGGAVLEEYALAPVRQGTMDVVIPYASRGFRAEVRDAAGALRLEADLSGSRVCNDDAVCDAQYGEDGDNCPTDCAATAGSAATAAIAPQIPVSSLLGAWLMRLSMAATAILLLGAAVRALDSRRRPYDN